MWHCALATTDERHTRLDGLTAVDVRRPAAAAVVLAASEEPLLLLGHASLLPQVRVLATYVAAHQPDRLVGHASTDHAPLAAAVAMERAVDLAVDAGHAASVWADVLGQCWSGAVLSSVTRLSRPNPTMAQHLRSWWPASRFLVRQGDDPRSVPVARADELLADLPRRALEAWVSDGADDAAVRQLVSSLAPARLRSVEGFTGWPGAFGSAEQFQLVLLPTDAHLAVRAPGPVCAGCGQHAADPVCVFCRTTTGPRAARAQPAGAAS